MTTCSGCGKRVVHGRLESGQRIALDADAPTYDLVIFDSSRGDYMVTRALTVRVAHRSVCTAPPAEPGSTAGSSRGRGGRG